MTCLMLSSVSTRSRGQMTTARVSFWVLFAVLLCLGTHPLSAQTAKTQPEPYTPEEFPEWAHDLRRAEVVSIGSFPLTYLLTTLVFDIGRYVDKLSTDPENAAVYAPLFFGDVTRKVYSEEEKTGLLLGSVGVSLTVALIDFIIGQIEKNEARERELRRAAAGEARAAAERALAEQAKALERGDAGLEESDKPESGEAAGTPETGNPQDFPFPDNAGTNQ